MSVRGLFIANLVVAAIMAGFGLWVASSLAPGTQLPVHWNAAGEVDRMEPAFRALLWPPAFSVLLGVVFAVIPRLDPLQHRLEASATVLRMTWIGVMLVMACVQIMVAAPALRWRIGPDLLLIGIGILLVLIGNALPKSRPSFFVGIRTPWTLTDTDNWIATHRLGGKLMMAAGLITVIAAFVPIAPAWRLPVMLGPLLAASLVPIAYSWWLWRRAVH